MNLHGDPIASRARATPDRPALRELRSGRSRSYAELNRRADAAAAVLSGRFGVGPSDRVAVLSRNNLEQVELLIACARLGAILVPLNWRLAPRELAGVMVDADPSVLFVDAPGAALAARLEQAPITIRLGDGWDAAGLPSPQRLDPDGTTPLLVLYTSGSTGRPKGAVLTHESILFNAMNTLMAWELGAADRTLISAPLFHTGGWNVLLLPLLIAGGCVALAPDFDADETLRAVQEHRLTALFGVPTMFAAMRRADAFDSADLASLQWVISGGAPCPLPEIEAWWRRGVEFRQGYGLTEVGPNCFTMPPGEGLRRAGTVGFAMPWLETRIVDGLGAEVADDDVGELLLRGPTVCAGYWRNPAATAAAIDADGWFHTGDLFARSSDGGFRCVGRRKEMFISGGENVYPGEVERVLAGIPGVVESAVVPVPHPLWGEVGHAFVAFAEHRIAADEILALCRSELAGYKVPKHVSALPELPKGPTGKIHKPTLSQMAAR